MINEEYNVNEDVDMYQSLSHNVMFTQLNAKKGIKLFGEIEISAVFEDYKQLYC